MDKDVFTEKCICWWSKNDIYGFIPNSECEVHGEKVKESLKKSVSYKKGKEALARLRKRNT